MENADLHDLPMIEELPEGVTDALYARDSYFFAVDGWGQMYSSRDYGMATYVAVSDTEVYIRDPFAGRPTGTWLKGERDGDKVSVTFPQKMLVETYPDWEQDPEGDLGITITDYYYAYKFTLKQGEDKSSFEIDSENPVITFTISDGELKQEGDAFIGMVGEYRMYDKDNNPYTGFNWMGFADGQLEYSKVTAKYEEAPADLTTTRSRITDEKSIVRSLPLPFCRATGTYNALAILSTSLSHDEANNFPPLSSGT